MSDLIRREDVIKSLQSMMQDCFPEAEEELDAVVTTVREIPSAEPERKIIRCNDCKWWDRLDEEHPYGYCMACRSGTHTERWDISIYRQCKFDFYCADAEPIENEDDDE